MSINRSIMDPLSTIWGRVFPREEIEARQTKAKELMTSQGIDALFLTDDFNCTYLSGFRPYVPGSLIRSRPNFLIVPLDNDPVFLVHEIKKKRVQEGSWIKDVRTYAQVFAAPVEKIQNIFDQMGLSAGTIGAELGFEQRLQMTFKDFMHLVKSMQRARLVDASDVLWKMRMTKSRMEIEYTKKICDITSKAYEHTFNEIETGMNEKQIFDIFSRHILDGGSDGAPHFVINIGATNGTRLPCDTVRLRIGDLLWIDAGSTFRGYYSDFSRLGVAGSPSDKQRKMHNLAWKAMQFYIDLIRPGISAAEVFEAYQKYVSRPEMRLLKAWGAGRIGHGIGLMITEPPSIASYDNTILKSGMVIALELAFPNKEGTFHVEEDVVVTDAGCRVISEAARDLFLL